MRVCTGEHLDVGLPAGRGAKKTHIIISIIISKLLQIEQRLEKLDRRARELADKDK